MDDKQPTFDLEFEELYGGNKENSSDGWDEILPDEEIIRMLQEEESRQLFEENEMERAEQEGSTTPTSNATDPEALKAWLKDQRNPNTVKKTAQVANKFM